MKKFGSFLLALLLFASAGCARTQSTRYQAEFLTLFDTVTTVIGYADSEAQFRELAAQIRDELTEYHELYDIYNDYAGVRNVKTINDNAGKEPVVVDARIISMLEFAKQEYERTDGAVNVALGPVLKIWHDYREAGLDDPDTAKVPPMDDLQAAALHADMEKIIIDKTASTVYLPDPEMRLDVGAIAKGYATEQVAREFERRGVTSLLLSVGGNVRAIGGKLVPDSKGETSWTVGVQNPDKSSEQHDLMLLQINGLSVVSSGIYERYYTVDGKQYHHIIDHNTLMPADYYAQVSIVCRDSGLGDALSTAVFCMPLEESMAYVESLSDVEAAWVMKDGTIHLSSGFSFYVKGK